MSLEGVIEQVSASSGGLPKQSLGAAMATRLGLGGDAHAHPKIHGGPAQALLLVTVEGIEELVAAGYALFAGALGENLTVRGLDRRQLRPGMRLLAGGAMIEITKVRTPCNALNVYGTGLKAAVYDRRVKAGENQSRRWGLSGFYASVEQEGWIRAGDKIAVVGPRR
ncbi:MAG: MOSC domain-containing protein [Bryobacteraceae bacterium]|nr:MOSC domain-containing protein [Bryobacteraceae bacterium]